MVLFRAARVSVPGKAILMGEHAVVYGRPGLVATVGARVTLGIVPRQASGLKISLPQWSSSRSEWSWQDVFEETARERERWVSGAMGIRRSESTSRGEAPPNHEAVRFLVIGVGETLSALGLAPPGLEVPTDVDVERDREAGRTAAQALPGLQIEIRSELPLGGGMGSSASVAVAVVSGIAASLERVLDYEQVDEIAFEIEARQHGRPSGIDNASVLRGGVLWFERDGEDLLIEPLDLDERSLDHFQLFHTGRPRESTGEVVAAVRRLRDQKPVWFEQRLDSMSRACHEMRRALLEAGDPSQAMRCYQRDLESLRVTPEPVARTIRAIEDAGGAAKISGAGALSGTGAGALLVYHRDPRALESLTCLEMLERFRAPLAVEGARIEHGSRADVMPMDDANGS